MKITPEELINAEDRANRFYNKNKSIKCPALGKVIITPDSMNHLRKKKRRETRTDGDKLMRYKCFLKIKEVLNKMHYYQEYQANTKNFTERKHGKKKTIKRMVQYFGFIVFLQLGIHKKRIKIIVSKTHNSNDYEFVSVIPSWSKGYNSFEEK